MCDDLTDSHMCNSLFASSPTPTRQHHHNNNIAKPWIQYSDPPPKANTTHLLSNSFQEERAWYHDSLPDVLAIRYETPQTGVVGDTRLEIRMDGSMWCIIRIWMNGWNLRIQGFRHSSCLRECNTLLFGSKSRARNERPLSWSYILFFVVPMVPSGLGRIVLSVNHRKISHPRRQKIGKTS